jgi:hypothetical protein
LCLVGGCRYPVVAGFGAASFVTMELLHSFLQQSSIEIF